MLGVDGTPCAFGLRPHSAHPKTLDVSPLRIGGVCIFSQGVEHAIARHVCASGEPGSNSSGLVALADVERCFNQRQRLLGTVVILHIQRRIEVDPEAKKHQSEQVTIILNKPVGYVSGQPEDNHQPAMVLIRPENRWAEDPSPIKFRHGHLRGLAPAGRLDIDSTGLIVFTQDGRVAKRLIGADNEVEKEYLVRVEGELTEEGMKLLHHGLELDGVKLKPARVSWANEGQLRFVLREGRKRQIRRMCEMVGLRVLGLKRVRIGGVTLGDLPPGQWRYLAVDEQF